MALESVVIGGTYNWPLTALKNGIAWDLRFATVNLYFWREPKEGEAAPSAVAVSVDSSTAQDGKVAGLNLSSTFNKEGTWWYSWKIIDGSTIAESEPRDFPVRSSLAAKV